MNAIVKERNLHAELEAAKLNRQLWRAKLEAEDAAIARGETVYRGQAADVQRCEESAAAAQTRRAQRLEAQLSGRGDVTGLHVVDEDYDSLLRKAQLRLSDTALALQLLRKKREDVAAGLTLADKSVLGAAHAIVLKELLAMATEFHQHFDDAMKVGAKIHEFVGNDLQHQRDERYQPLPPTVLAAIELLPKRNMLDIPVNEYRFGSTTPPAWYERLQQLMAEDRP